MSVTILSKPPRDVKDVYNKSLDYKWQLEDGCERYIKQQLGIEE